MLKLTQTLHTLTIYIFYILMRNIYIYIYIYTLPFVFIYCFLYIAFYFITLLIQFWFLLFWHTVIIIYILILVLIVITINFYVLLLLLYIFFCSVINIIVPCIINVIYFNLSHFNSYCSCYYDFCLRVACGVYGSLFSYCRLYHHCHHHNHFIFLNTASHWGRIQQLNSSGMVYTYPLITLGKPQGKY